MESVNKKRSAGGRALALASALFLLVSVLIIPASAAALDPSCTDNTVTLGAPDWWKDFDYFIGSDEGYVESMNARWTALSPYKVTLSDFSVEWRQDDWTYLSIEIAHFEDESHWTVNAYKNSSSGQIVLSFFYYDGVNVTTSEQVFQVAYPTIEDLDPFLFLEYWNEGEAVMCRVAVGSKTDSSFRHSKTIKLDRPFNARVKTEYAGATYRKTFGSVNPLTEDYAGGFEDGYSDGKKKGYENGHFDGSKEVFDMFYDAYYKRGGTYEYYRIEDYNSLVEYFEDVGWTECANQGGLTVKLIYTALEAPLNIILGGLDFTVFGINLAETIFAVLSIIIVFAIVRVVLAVLPLV